MDITLSVCSIFDTNTAAEWEGIYKTNPALSYFSSYEFNSLFVKKFSKNKKRHSMKIVLVKACEKTKGTILFLPLCKKNSNYYMMWDYSSVPYCDAIYRADTTKEEYDYIFDHISEVIGNNTIYFTKMNETSAFTAYLHDRFTPYKKRSCGTIELLKSYDYTYKLIDKECRENIEEAQSKIEEQGLQYKTDFYCCKTLSVKAYTDISTIIYGENLGFFKKLENSKHSKNSAIIQSIKQGNSSFVEISYIDDYPVACLYGFIRDKSMIVTKIASTKYGVGYSSIHLIIRDLIRYLVDSKKVDRIDLCRLDDKIKSDFASKKHYIYSFEVKL